MDKLEAEKRNLQNKVELGYGMRGGGDSVGGASSFLRSETSVPLSLQHPNSQSGPLSGPQLPLGFRPSSDLNDNKGTLSLGGSESRGSALDQDVVTLSSNVQHLRNEVDRLKAQLSIAQQQRKLKQSFGKSNYEFIIL